MCSGSETTGQKDRQGGQSLSARGAMGVRGSKNGEKTAGETKEVRGEAGMEGSAERQESLGQRKARAPEMIQSTWPMWKMS